MAELDLTSEKNRELIARRLRGIADNIEHGRVTADSFDYEAEWKGTSMTGRVFLKLGFWVRPLNPSS
jgi:hypothetical protein